ncbi:MAG: hypothetical protein J0L73_19415 [Verrucomicrobia bacterium]|nr:hypothetical protein [Verrucomicrobiota bacterium]
MKTHLIAVLLIACTGHLAAQSNSSGPSGTKQGLEWANNPDAAGNVMLPPGTLREIVEYIEQKLMPKWADHVGTMPNILMSQEVGHLEMPGVLTLHRVSPLQAVALAAAAVECSLEPILDPTPSTGSTGSPLVLGYRITRVKTTTPGSDPAASPKVSAPTVPGEPTKPTTGASQLVIRIYAVGAVLHAGSPDEIKRDEAMFQLVLHEALDKSEPGAPPLDLTLHSQSKALIVKATAAQQEIVEQVIKALKENNEQEARSAATVKP